MKNTKQGSIRQFITLWVGAVWLSFALMVGGLLWVMPRLNAKTQREYADSRTLDENRRFELALMAQTRDELQWRLDNAARPRVLLWSGAHPPTLALREADAALAALQNGEASATTTEAEARLITSLTEAYRPVRVMALAPVHEQAQSRAAFDRLLSLVHQHRDLNVQQMTATLRSGYSLDTQIDRWTIGLLLGATALTIAGSLMLWARLFTPVLKLAEAVETFGSDLQARAPVLRDDEMGHLAQTFNNMAAAIADRERDRLRFVATVAHDLRNPLVVIGGAAHLLKRKDMRLSPEERAKWLGSIQQNTHNLEVMIGDLMDGVQAETGQLVFDWQEVDLGPLTREIVEELAATNETYLIRHDITTSCVVKGDRKRLERVLMNLLSNAVKYSPVGCEVHVSLLGCDASRSDAQAVWTVRDEGVGIAAEDLPRLFLPFSRLEHTKKMASGTGLGLSSVKKIVEGHGGTIRVQSVLGEGTRVEVCLPLLGKQDHA